jgi:flagellar biogenesis protein FliO
MPAFPTLALTLAFLAAGSQGIARGSELSGREAYERHAQAAADEDAQPRAAAPRAAQAAPDPVADKFRKLQREMSRDESTPGGDSQRAAPSRAEEESPGVFGVSMKILFGLVFVIILAVVAIRLLKRLQGRMLARAGSRRASGEIFEVLETCHLGQHHRVVALRIKDEVGIVGVTQQGMSLLTMLKEPAEDVRRDIVGEANPAAFSDNLNKLLERFKRPKRVSDLLDEQ